MTICRLWQYLVGVADVVKCCVVYDGNNDELNIIIYIQPNQLFFFVD